MRIVWFLSIGCFLRQELKALAPLALVGAGGSEHACTLLRLLQANEDYLHRSDPGPTLCRSFAQFQAFPGRSKTTIDLGPTVYCIRSRAEPWSEKSSGLLKAVSTILFHCRGVPSCGEWRRRTAHRRGFRPSLLAHPTGRRARTMLSSPAFPWLEDQPLQNGLGQSSQSIME